VMSGIIGSPAGAGVNGLLGGLFSGGGGVAAGSNAAGTALSYAQLSQNLMDQGLSYNDAVRIASAATSGGGGGGSNVAGTALSAAGLASGGGAGAGIFTGGGLAGPFVNLYTGVTTAASKVAALAAQGPGAILEAIIGVAPGTIFGTTAVPGVAGMFAADVSAMGGLTAATTTATAATEGAAVAMEGVTTAAGTAVPALGMVAPALLAVSAIAMVIMDQLGKAAEEARWNARVEQAKQVYAATPGSAQQAADLLINAETGGAAAGLSYNVSTGRWESTAGQVGQGVQIQALADAGMLSEREMETLYWSRLQAMTASGGGGGGGEGGSGRQHGGPVRAGRPYLVGEAGPELIIPRDAGTVVPNRQIREAMGGGGALNVIVNVAGSLVGVGSKDELIRYIMSGIRQLNRRLPGVNMFPVTG